MSLIRKNSLILFQGDSVTDAGRNRETDDLGPGYPQKVQQYLSAFCGGLHAKVVNRGVSGDRIRDLQRRWQEDCIGLKPDVVNILVGINDCWRRFDSGDPTTVEEFEAGYRDILMRTRAAGAVITMMEPYVLPYPEDRVAWRQDLDPKIHAVRRLAREFAAVLIPLDGILAGLSVRDGLQRYSADGIHPTDAGHVVIAKEWLRAVGLL
jgi:lysophospholipase L1-like esterase